ncbi:phage major capsid protein, partial [Mycobacteroides abscessus subsp. abscessus]
QRYDRDVRCGGQSRTSAGAFIVPDRTDIVEMLGRRPLRLRDLCAKRRTTSDVVEYVRETSHTNNAAPVPEASSAAAPTAPGSAGPLVTDPIDQNLARPDAR